MVVHSRIGRLPSPGMNTLYPWQLFVITVAGWINRQQQDVIDYLIDENRILKRQLRGKRLRLTDEERRRLAVKGRALGRAALEKVAGALYAADRSQSDRCVRWVSSPEALPHLGLEEI